MGPTAALLVFAGFFVYLVPWFVAARRNHPNTTAIAALNLLLGWTFLGWVAALVWALTAVPGERVHGDSR